MTELKAWIDAEYGSRAEIARVLGVPQQRVTDWFAVRYTPTLELGLRLQLY
jgi:predicted XRE-type DNA-binding protein